MVLVMYYKRNNKRLSVSGRGDYMSTSDFIIQYYTNLDACRKFFYDIKWPTGYYCEKCGCTHYYFMKLRIAIVVLTANMMKDYYPIRSFRITNCL